MGRPQYAIGSVSWCIQNCQRVRKQERSILELEAPKGVSMIMLETLSENHPSPKMAGKVMTAHVRYDSWCSFSMVTCITWNAVSLSGTSRIHLRLFEDAAMSETQEDVTTIIGFLVFGYAKQFRISLADHFCLWRKRCDRKLAANTKTSFYLKHHFNIENLDWLFLLLGRFSGVYWKPSYERFQKKSWMNWNAWKYLLALAAHFTSRENLYSLGCESNECLSWRIMRA